LLWAGAGLAWPALSQAQAASQAQARSISPKAAESAFLRFWAEWSRRSENAAQAESLSELVRAGSPSRTLRSGKACRDLVIDRWGPTPPADTLLHGRLDALSAAPRCWELVYDGRLRGGLVANVDAQQARVLLLWRTPGG